jgi:hypothetical protein
MMIWERKSYALMNGIDLALLLEVQGIALRFDAVATILNQAATFSTCCHSVATGGFRRRKNPTSLESTGM